MMQVVKGDICFCFYRLSSPSFRKGISSRES